MIGEAVTYVWDSYQFFFAHTLTISVNGLGTVKRV